MLNQLGIKHKLSVVKHESSLRALRQTKDEQIPLHWQSSLDYKSRVSKVRPTAQLQDNIFRSQQLVRKTGEELSENWVLKKSLWRRRRRGCSVHIYQ